MNLDRALLDAVPFYSSGFDFLNLVTSGYHQAKVGAGVLGGVTISAGGSSSNVEAFDGISATVTFTLAAPGVVGWPDHPFVAGSPVRFTTTDTLPTGVTAGTTYFVAVTDLEDDSFKLSDTAEHALAGTDLIETSVDQAGVHTGWDVGRPMCNMSTTAQANLPFGISGLRFREGLIIVAGDGGAPADITVSFI